jgi:hypothetical protein
VRATFRLQTLQANTTPTQLQHAQIVLLDFNTLSWPHVTVCPVDHAAESFVVGVVVVPGDVAADHAALFAVGGVAGSVEGELAQLRDSHP